MFLLSKTWRWDRLDSTVRLLRYRPVSTALAAAICLGLAGPVIADENLRDPDGKPGLIDDPDLPFYAQPLLSNWDDLQKLNESELIPLAAGLVGASLRTGANDYECTNPLQNVVACWTALNPAAALDFAVKAPRASFRKTAVRAVFYVLASTKPEEAWRLAGAMTDPGLKQWASVVIRQRTTEVEGAPPFAAAQWLAKVLADPASEWTGSVPDGVVELLADQPDNGMAVFAKLNFNTRQYLAPRLVSAWTVKGEEATVAWLSTQPAPIRLAALNAIWSAKATADPASVFETLPPLPARLRETVLKTAFATLVTSAPEKAVAALCALEAPERFRILEAMLQDHSDPRPVPVGTRIKRDQALLGLISDIPTRHLLLVDLGDFLAVGDAGPIRSELQKLPEDDRIAVTRQLVAPLKKKDPLLAQELMLTIPPARRNDELVRAMAEAALQSKPPDPDAAIELALSCKSVRERSDLLDRSFQLLAGANLSSAIAHLDTLPADVRESAFRGIVGIESPPVASLEWAERQAGAARVRGIGIALVRYNRTHPAMVRKRVIELLATEPPENRPGFDLVVGMVTLDWAKEDPEAARTWLFSQPEDALRYAGMLQTYSGLAMKDTAKAEAWLKACPAGRARDRVLLLVAMSAQRSQDKELAVRLLAAVTDFESNMAELQRSARYIASWHPGPLAAALEREGVPAEMAGRITTPPKE